MITTCVSSTDEQLTTTGAVKTLLGATGTSDDAMLNDLISRASRAVERYVGYPLTRQVYSETLAGFGSNLLAVSRRPVRAIAQILKSTEVVESTSYYIQSSEGGLIWRDRGWLWTAGVEQELTQHVVPHSEQRLFQVDYEAGFVYGGLLSTIGGTTSTGRTLPEDIEAATLETVKSWYRGRARDSAVESKSVGDLKIQYRSGALDEGALPPLAARLLNPWRSFA